MQISLLSEISGVGGSATTGARGGCRGVGVLRPPLLCPLSLGSWAQSATVGGRPGLSQQLEGRGPGLHGHTVTCGCGHRFFLKAAVVWPPPLLLLSSPGCRLSRQGWKAGLARTASPVPSLLPTLRSSPPIFSCTEVRASPVSWCAGQRQLSCIADAFSGCRIRKETKIALHSIMLLTPKDEFLLVSV